MGIWDEVRAEAIAVIKTNGRLCRLIVTAPGVTPDPDKPWNAEDGDPVYYPAPEGGNFAVSDVPIPNSTGKDSTGELGKSCIIPGDVGIDVDETMQVELMDGAGAGVYSIVSLNTYAPDGVTRIGWKARLQAWPQT